MAPSEASGERPRERHVFLEAVLHPYRSLPPRAFIILMVGLASLSLVAGTICILVGAWPVFGFFGLDVALVYVAFRISYRSARQHERVRLTDESLTVERVSVRGVRLRWRFEPYWLRVLFKEDEDTNSLAVASHGRTLVLGRFLAPNERRDFARQLARALERWRAFISGREEE
jgi:uncharacterized membrane protein